MKKILAVLVVFSIIYVSAYAAESTYTFGFTQKLRNIGQRFTQSSDDIDLRVAKQQQEYENKISAQEEKIQKQEQQRQQTYNAAQKRLETKREQLRELLER